MINMIARRRRDSITNYRKRLALLKGDKTRLVVRKTNRHIIIELVDYKVDGDKVLTTVNSKDLEKLGWVSHSNLPTAYLAGLMMAKKAKELKFSKEVLLDMGLYKPMKNGVIFAAAEGCIDGGLKVIGSFKVDKERISGKHIADYIKEDPSKEKLFSSYSKNKFNAKNFPETFKEIKSKINGA